MRLTGVGSRAPSRISPGHDAISGTAAGPWSEIFAESVPKVLAGLPPDFRTTHQLGKVPYRYVTGSRSELYDYGSRYDYGWYGSRYDYGRYGPRYRSGRYYRDHDRRGYRRRLHPLGNFLFFVAPHLDNDDWYYRYRWWDRGRGRD